MKWMGLLLALLFVGSASAAGLQVQNKSITRKDAHAEVSVAYPQTGNAAIDRQLAGWAKEQADGFQGNDEDDPSSSSPWTLDIGYDVVRNDDAMFSVVFAIHDYTGGAHPNHAFATFNFLRPEGESLDIEQVVDGQRGLQRLSALAVARLKRKLLPDEESDAEWIARGAAPKWSNFDDFVLLPNRLRILFGPYAVAPYSSGPQEIEVPLSALQGALRSDPRVPAPSFDCARAGNAAEHAICSSTVLSRLDRQLARAYSYMLDVLADDDAARVQREQRAWIGQRNSACGAAPNEGAAACVNRLQQLYSSRLEALKPRDEL